ncbi:hypothetical protein DIPPA_30128 [Diplonema papillatum]|nr:hypothetical protein DIPPA_30128 [Diplonema papillatum]
MRTRTSKTQGPTTEDLYSSILLLPAPPHGRRPSRSRRRSGTRGGKARAEGLGRRPARPVGGRAGGGGGPAAAAPAASPASHWESWATRTRRRARKVGYRLGGGHSNNHSLRLHSKASSSLKCKCHQGRRALVTG